MSDDRSPNLDELDDLMERVQAKAPPPGDSAEAALARALALIDVKLAAGGGGRGPRGGRQGSIDP